MSKIKENFKNKIMGMINLYEDVKIKFDCIFETIKLPNGDFASPYMSKGKVWQYGIVDTIEHKIDIYINNNENIYINGVLVYSSELLSLVTELQELLDNNNGLRFGDFEEFKIIDGVIHTGMSFNNSTIDIYELDATRLLNEIDYIKSKMEE